MPSAAADQGNLQCQLWLLFASLRWLRSMLWTFPLKSKVRSYKRSKRHDDVKIKIRGETYRATSAADQVVAKVNLPVVVDEVAFHSSDVSVGPGPVDDMHPVVVVLICLCPPSPRVTGDPDFKPANFSSSRQGTDLSSNC